MVVHNGVAVHRSTRFLMGQSFSKATRLVGLAAVKFLRTWRDGFTSRPTAERHGALERWMGRGRYVSSCFSTRRWGGQPEAIFTPALAVSTSPLTADRPGRWM